MRPDILAAPRRILLSPHLRRISVILVLAIFGLLPLYAQSPLPSDSISGRLIDKNASPVVGARVRVLRDGKPLASDTESDNDGRYSFRDISPGSFQLTMSAQGFASQTFSGTLTPGQDFLVPQITLPLATEVTEVHVSLSTIEIAQEQVKEQEQQRVLGLIPNFYVSYAKNPVPLTSKQKFSLAWKTTTDPVSFLSVGVIAGIDQAAGRYNGYGQGAAGYARRYGASYGNLLSGIYIGDAILPSILKQDPRYFYKGTGTTRSRLLYALANAVICKGDNMKWQPNYSGIVGDLASGAISNLYYAPEDRNGAALTFENAAIGIASSAAINVLEEFVLRRFTPSQRNAAP